MTMRFTHDTLGQRVILEAGGAAVHVQEELIRLGAVSTMIIGTGREDRLLEQLQGPDRVRWTEIAQHVPVTLVERARRVAAQAGIDVVVAVGGGSAIGLAKAIALTEPVRVIAVPTTYAGSEATNVWGVTDHDGKQTGVDPRVLPVSVIYDAELTMTMPAALAAASGLNAVAHCIDTFWAPRADPINAALASEGLQALHTGLRQLVGDPTDLSSREQTQFGCYLAAAAFASAGSAMHHRICHVLGGMFDLPHAATHAIVLPYVLAWNASAAPGASRRIAAAFDTADPVVGLDELRTHLNAPRALRDIGLARADIPRAVAAALAVIPTSNPRPVDTDSLTRLLYAAWAGSAPASLTDEAAA